METVYYIKAQFIISNIDEFDDKQTRKVIILTGAYDTFDLAFREIKKKYDLFKCHHSEVIINSFKTYIENFKE
jgi:hypothetical protein